MTTIGDVAEVFDGPHATPKKVEEGPYFLSISSLENGSLDLSKSARVSEEDFVKWTRRVTPKEGDVLFSYETRLGDAAMMPPNLMACLGRRMGLLRPDREKVIPEYLLYAYLAPAFQETIRSKTNHGATVDRIALKELPDFPIRIPYLDEQRNVVEILKSIDNKIQLNRQTNQTLEQIAQAIFKSWFVDFEPVKAKVIVKEKGGSPLAQSLAAQAILCGAITLEQLTALENDYRGLEAQLHPLITQRFPEQHGLDYWSPEQLQTTAELFPDALVGSELGKVPKGWELHTVEGVMELAYGKALKKTDRTDGEFPVYGSGGFTGTHNKSLVEGPGIIIGRKGTIGSLHWEYRDFYPIDTVFYVVCKNAMTLPFAFYLLQGLGLSEMNTDAAVPGLNRNNVYRLEIPNYPDDVIECFTDLVGSVRKAVESFQIENDYLSQLRDTLLPKLLSGKLGLDQQQLENSEANA